MSALTRSLGRVRRRLRLLRVFDVLDIGLAAAEVLFLLIVVSSFFIPMPDLRAYALCAIAAPFALALASLFMPVPPLRAARAADACGLKERAQTALEYNGDAPMDELLRADALRALQALDLRKALPLRKPRRWTSVVMSLSTIALIILNYVPNPQDAVLLERAELREMLDHHADAIDETAKTLAEEAQDAQTDELTRLAEELSQSLRKSDSKTDALLAANRADEQYQKIEAERAQTARESAARALEGAGLDALADAARTGDAQNAAEAAAALGEAASSGDADAQSLSEALERAAEALADEQALSEALGSAAQAASGAAGGAGAPSLQQALNAAAGRLTNLASSGPSSNLQARIAALRAALAGASGAPGAPGAGMKPSGGAGQSQGQGQGAGSGAGLGSTQKDTGYTEGGGRRTSDGSGPSVYKTGEYESIYDPTRLGDGGEISQVQGEVREGEISQAQLAPGLGDDGGSVPYNQVIGEYGQSASRAAGDPGVPAHVRQWVDQYFDALIESAGG